MAWSATRTTVSGNPYSSMAQADQGEEEEDEQGEELHFIFLVDKGRVPKKLLKM